MSWLGVDLGGTWLRIGDDAPVPVAGLGPDGVMARIADAARSGGHGGAAISFAGWIGRNGRTINAGPNLGWGPVDLSAMAAGHGLDLHLENDLDARAWGEFMAWDGDGDLMVINAGSGFAVGLVCGGQLLRGAHRRAGEVGHLRMAEDGRCGCGSEGCVEALLGGAHHQPERFDEPRFVARWLDRACAVVAPVIAAFDPAHVIATGGIFDARPELVAAFQRQLIERLPEAWWGELVLHPSAGGEALARVGAVALASNRGPADD